MFTRAVFKAVVGLVFGVVLTCFLVTLVAEAQERPSFRYKRWQEDWRALCDPQLQTQPLDRLKCIELGAPGLAVTFGGEIRERFDFIRNPTFGLTGVGTDHYWTTRMLLHANVWIRNEARIYVELGSHLASDRRFGLSPTDRDDFDVQQAFFDYFVPLRDDAKLTLRGGRQELSFGSSRLVSVRDGANIRRAFDGGSIILKAPGIETTAFAARPVQIRTGAFDDSPDPATTFFGLYNTLTGFFPKGQSLDLYYLGYLRDNARFAAGRQDERRHSFGIRHAGTHQAWDWDNEAVLQIGDFGTSDIAAWMVSSEVGYTLPGVHWKPRLALEMTAASGDKDLSDGRLGTFNPLFPVFPLFTQAGMPSPANLLELHPTLTFYPANDLRLIIGWSGMWKEEKNDAYYSPVLVPRMTTVGADRFIGQRMHLELKYSLNPAVDFFAKYQHFWAGDGLASSGGRDGDYFGTWISAKF